MILSHGRRYIFLHAPKTGGTSLALALEARAMRDDIMAGDTPKSVNRRRRLKGLETTGRLWKHSQLRDLYGLVTQEEVERYFVFTLVRNPWDRMVSYYHWLQSQRFEHPAVALAKATNFSDFLNAPLTSKSFSAQPYAAFTTDAAGTDQCNLAIRLEHLHEDIAPLEEHLGFALGEIAHVNRSARATDYRQFYSDQDAAHLARICAEDIARFSYRFDPE